MITFFRFSPSNAVASSQGGEHPGSAVRKGGRATTLAEEFRAGFY